MKLFLQGLLTGLLLCAVWLAAYELSQPCETDMECEMRYGE